LDNEIVTRAVAGFAQVRFGFEELSLTPAIRVERVRQRIENRFPGREARVTQAYTQLLPGVGTTFRSGDRATLFAGVHRGFAPPRPADVYRPEPGQPIVLVDPETSWNWEVGARVSPHDGLSAAATLFRMDFGNQVMEAPASEGQRFVNGGRTVHQGLELSARASLATLLHTPDDLILAAAYTHLPVARFADDDGRGAGYAGNRLPYAARNLASGSATFVHRSGLTVGASLEYTGSQFADEENTITPDTDGQIGVLPSEPMTNALARYWQQASDV